MPIPPPEWITNKFLSSSVLKLLSDGEKRSLGFTISTVMHIILLGGLAIITVFGIRLYMQEISLLDNEEGTRSTPASNTTNGFSDDSCWSMQTLNNQAYKFNRCTGDTIKVP